MIFVTVGTQLPFDRLLQAVDQWGHKNPEETIVAQTGPSDFQSSRIDTRRFVDISEFKELVQQADVLVAHAGMGSILSALEYAKPIIIMPRLASLGEHRNDHQLATAKGMAHLQNLQVIQNADDLSGALKQALNPSATEKTPNLVSKAHRRLVDEISQFISGPNWDGMAAQGAV